MERSPLPENQPRKNRRKSRWRLFDVGWLVVTDPRSFYKNLVYKNIKASKCPRIKHVVVILLVAISFKSFEKDDVLIKKRVYLLLEICSLSFVNIFCHSAFPSIRLSIRPSLSVAPHKNSRKSRGKMCIVVRWIFFFGRILIMTNPDLHFFFSQKRKKGSSEERKQNHQFPRIASH